MALAILIRVCHQAMASRRRRGRRRKDGGNPRSFRRKRAVPAHSPSPMGPPKFSRQESGSATWPKMLAQEMPSATRSNKMPSPTRSMKTVKPAVWGFRYRTTVRVPRRAIKTRRRQDCRGVSGYAEQLLLSSRYCHVEIELIPKFQIPYAREKGTHTILGTTPALGSRRESPGAITDFEKVLHNPPFHARVTIRGQREHGETAKDTHDPRYTAP